VTLCSAAVENISEYLAASEMLVSYHNTTKHGIMSQKALTCVFTAVKTTNLAEEAYILLLFVFC
jgi:hypothetical protein